MSPRGRRVMNHVVGLSDTPARLLVGMSSTRNRPQPFPHHNIVTAIVHTSWHISPYSKAKKTILHSHTKSIGRLHVLGLFLVAPFTPSPPTTSTSARRANLMLGPMPSWQGSGDVTSRFSASPYLNSTPLRKPRPTSHLCCSDSSL